MNKKGQSLIAFIILLPVLLIAIGYVIETSFIAYNKNKIYSVTKSVIANCIDECEKDDIIKLYDKNDIELNDINVDRDRGLSIRLNSYIDSFLGKVINKDKYEVNISIKGYKEDNKIKFEKGS